MAKYRLKIDFGQSKKGEVLNHNDKEKYYFCLPDILFDFQIPEYLESGIIEEIPEVPKLHEWTDEDVRELCKKILSMENYIDRDPQTNAIAYIVNKFKKEKGIK